MKVFVGGDVVNSSKGSGKILGADLERIVRSADVSIVNLEGPVDGAGSRQSKVGRHISNRRATVRGLVEQGVDLFLLANNHIMDFGAHGLAATIAEIEAYRARYIGAGLDGTRPSAQLVWNVDGLRLGLLNMGEAQFGATSSAEAELKAGYAWTNDPSIETWIRQLREQSDFVIVLPHAGLENVPIPQRYWRDTYRWFCEIGADVVIGGHPHVPQGYERHGDALVFYSVGNLFFDTAQGPGRAESGFSVLLDLELGREARFELVHHRRRGSMVDVASEGEHVDVDSLCAMLGEEYESIHDRMTREKFALLRRMLLTSVGKFPNNPDALRGGQRLVKRLLRRPVEDPELLLLHALRNETWRKLGEDHAQLEGQQRR